jgi:hypothetical protein
MDFETKTTIDLRAKKLNVAKKTALNIMFSITRQTALVSWFSIS